MTVGASGHFSSTDELTASSFSGTDRLLRSFIVMQSGRFTQSVPFDDSGSLFESEIFRETNELSNSELVGDSLNWTFSIAQNGSAVLELSGLLNETQLLNDSEVVFGSGLVTSLQMSISDRHQGGSVGLVSSVSVNWSQFGGSCVGELSSGYTKTELICTGEVGGSDSIIPSKQSNQTDPFGLSSGFGERFRQRQTGAFGSDFIWGRSAVADHSGLIVPSFLVVGRSEPIVASNRLGCTHFLMRLSSVHRGSDGHLRSAQLVGSELFTPPAAAAKQEVASGLFTIIGVVLGVLLLLAVAVAVGIWYCRRKRWPSMDYSDPAVEFGFESHDLTGPTNDLGTFENVITYNHDLSTGWQSGMTWLDGGLPFLDDDAPRSGATFLGE
jgi:hypothetical protein